MLSNQNPKMASMIKKKKKLQTNWKIILKFQYYIKPI